jgi:hypothetical protein
MWTLSGFADEVSADIDEQCRVFNELGIGYVEFRGAWDTNVLDLDDDQLDLAARRLAAHPIPARCPMRTCTSTAISSRPSNSDAGQR